MPYLGRTSFLPCNGFVAMVVYMVSMPYLGRTSFLQKLSFNVANVANLCQCPISGALHFYVLRKCNKSSHMGVSMPYLGRTSFLQSKSSASPTGKTVSMPYLGRTSFLRKKEMETVKIVCVNALSRAHFIST